MKSIIPLTIIVPTLCWLALSAFASGQNGRLASPTGSVSKAMQSLQAAANADSQEQAAVDAVAKTVTDVLETLMPSPVSEQLEKAAAEYREGGNPVDFLQAVKQVCAKLSFQPLKEAQLPSGFPTYTPDGVVEVKQYPVYRMAVAGQFWTLFRHIQSNDIAMTAPVEMTFDATSAGKLSQNSMAFLYGDPSLGQTGKNGKVNVVDVKPVQVVSIGVRGSRSQASVQRAYQYLLKWIDTQQNLEAAGSPRVLGYNSPMVRRADNFFEVQIPIREKSTSASG
jgi:hypothetical protein